MASLSFVAPDGTESRIQLEPGRIVQIGRDPGNDLVLRDPRVSRQHAEIVFDRGFFVIRDLGSSNGTWVNGTKVRTAPLTNQAELKIGNSLGRFIDVPPQGSMEGTLSVDLFRRTAGDAAADAAEKGGQDSLARKGRLPVTGGPPTKPDPFPEAGAPPSAGEAELAGWDSLPAAHAETSIFRHSLYVLDVNPAHGEPSIVRDAEGNVLLRYERPRNVAGFVAGFAAAMLSVTGAVIAAFLYLTANHLPAVLAIVVSFGFAVLILLLVPRRKHVRFHAATDGEDVPLMLWQESRFSFPVLRFSLRGARAEPISLLSRGAGSMIGRHRWRIEHPLTGETLGCAVESSYPAALLRKVLGSFFGLVVTDYRLMMNRAEVGTIRRRSRGVDHSIVDLTADSSFVFDRRIAIGLAAIIDGMERK
jgi:hypothetical protein